MQNSLLLILSILVLISYLFEVISPRTKIPSVLLVLLLGIGIKQFLIYLAIPAPVLDHVLPLLGTIGLILIVFEGALELPIDRTNVPMIRKSVLSSLISLILTSASIAFFFKIAFAASLQQGMLYAIALSVISSAIAVPTARLFSKEQSSFIVFESSFSDIIGVLLFNFFLLNEKITVISGLNFILQIFFSLIISILGTAVLVFLLNNLKHKIRFIPIIAVMLIMYAVAKHFHLSALILVLVMGLFLANSEKFAQQLNRFKLNPQRLLTEVKKLEEIIAELTFVIRVSFFLLFGYTLNIQELFNPNTALLASVVVMAIVFFRALLLWILKLPWFPYLFIAPRGLITLLLFMSIPLTLVIPQISKGFITQVVVMSILIMMISTVFSSKKNKPLGSSLPADN
jgi:NhaP-type Na+/H+ or K+/H+ antiporter